MRVTKIHGDFETFNSAGEGGDLSRIGLHTYAGHDHTGIWCLGYQLDEAPPKLAYFHASGASPTIATGPDYDFNRAYCGQPEDLLNAVEAGSTFGAHNVPFEFYLWNRCLRRKYFPRWPELKLSQMDCTMARAAAYGLPLPLADLAKTLALPIQKDQEGAKIMRELMVLHHGHPLATPERLTRQGVYCISDVGAESGADFMLPPLSAWGRRLWELDFKINERGVPFDVEMTEQAQFVMELVREEADREFLEITSGACKSINQNKAFLAWLQGRGFTDLKGVSAWDLENLNTDADDVATKAVELRTAFAKSSLAKLDKITWAAMKDGRARGQYVIFGAGPGRFISRDIQVHNFPRTDPEGGDAVCSLLAFHCLEEFRDTTQGVSGEDRRKAARKAYDAIATLTGRSVLKVCSKSLRPLIRATPAYGTTPGNTLVDTDLSNIEGRVNAWNGREMWKLQAFRDYDAKTGPDLYKVAYSKAFGVAIDAIRKKERQIGKVIELSCGYQGGVGAVKKMGPTYGMPVEALIGPIKEASSEELWHSTCAKFSKAVNKLNLGVDAWAAAQILVGGFRNAHPGITRSWRNLQDAALWAIDSPGHHVTVEGEYRGIGYLYDGLYLWCNLPSGRLIPYFNPKIHERRSAVIVFDDGHELPVEGFSGAQIDEILYANPGAEYKPPQKQRVIVYQARHGRKGIYGGLQCENCVQGEAFDVQAEKMMLADDAGINIIMHTHDSITAEEPKWRADWVRDELHKIMHHPVSWAPDLPLAAGIDIGDRYGMQ